MVSTGGGDLFGNPSGDKPRAKGKRDHLIDRLHQAEADRPQAQAALEAAQADCASYNTAWWRADEELRRAVKDPKSTPDSRRPFYDARLWAGYDRHPFRQAVKDAERWLREISREIDICHKALDDRPERPVRLVDGARMLRPRKPTTPKSRAV